jgi:hypothetical protein
MLPALVMPSGHHRYEKSISQAAAPMRACLVSEQCPECIPVIQKALVAADLVWHKYDARQKKKTGGRHGRGSR